LKFKIMADLCLLQHTPAQDLIELTADRETNLATMLKTILPLLTEGNKYSEREN